MLWTDHQVLQVTLSWVMLVYSIYTTKKHLYHYIPMKIQWYTLIKSINKKVFIMRPIFSGKPNHWLYIYNYMLSYIYIDIIYNYRYNIYIYISSLDPPLNPHETSILSIFQANRYARSCVAWRCRPPWRPCRSPRPAASPHSPRRRSPRASRGSDLPARWCGRASHTYYVCGVLTY